MESAGPPGAISVHHLNKTFKAGRKRNITALSDINLRIQPGEFVALLGPSGCGKSTLLRLIAGLEEPTSGHVEIDSKTPRQVLAEHRLGFAFQEHALLPWSDVRKNVSLPFKLAGRRVDSRRVDDMIELVGLSQFRQARPKQLSGGMRQRVAIARALVTSPDLLLLDEPFGALDEITRQRLNYELAEIWTTTRATTVLVTHSVQEALVLADRVIVMTARPGRILRDVEVALPRPRTEETITDQRFTRLATQLIRLLDHDRTDEDQVR